MAVRLVYAGLLLNGLWLAILCWVPGRLLTLW
jgi:hypothetical protein